MIDSMKIKFAAQLFFVAIIVLAGIYAPSTLAKKVSSAQAAADLIEVWWPTNGVELTGTQPFKGLLKNRHIGEYIMYWQVDGGNLNLMPDSYADYPHKEASADVTNWNWKGKGPYVLTFVAKTHGGEVIAARDVTIYIKQADAPAAQPAPISTPTPAPTPAAPTANTTANNPLAGAKLYVNPYSDAKKTADSWRTSRPADASLMDKVANSPETVWFGNWNANITEDVRKAVDATASQGATPVMVAYNIPIRDCGGYSAGGANSPDGYRSWIRSLTEGLGSNKTVVILEPDALTLTDCLSESDKQTRFDLIRYAVQTLKSAGKTVYIDAGHSAWISAPVMAERLKKAGVEIADGFALNVSNYQTTSDSAIYGKSLSALIGDKHFVIDTSRNGQGPSGDGQWCNPWGRGLGIQPTTQTGNSLIDAYLWVKRPGESDGTCNGGPSAGNWWPDYALELARKAAF